MAFQPVQDKVEDTHVQEFVCCPLVDEILNATHTMNTKIHAADYHIPQLDGDIFIFATSDLEIILG